MKRQLRAAVRAALKDLSRVSISPHWFAMVRNGGCEQSFRNLLQSKLQRIVGNSIAFSEASVDSERRIDIALRRLSKPETVLGIVEVKFNFTSQSLSEIRKRLITQAQGQLTKVTNATDELYCVYVIASLYVRADPQAPIATAHKQMHNNRELPPYKLFICDSTPDHHSWMEQHCLRPEQLVNKKPIVLKPVDAKRDGSRAALSVAVIPYRDLERVDRAFMNKRGGEKGFGSRGRHPSVEAKVPH